MRFPAAGVGCACNIDSGITLLYELDLPCLIDDEAGAIADPPIGHQDAIGGCGFPIDEVAEEGKRKGKLL